MSDYVWQPIGGHLALDLVNTRSWRLDPARSVDRLTDPTRLADWCTTVAHWPLAPVGRDPGSALRGVRAVRDAAIRVLDAHVDGREVPADDLAYLTGAWRAATARATVSRGLPLEWRVVVQKLDDVPDALALEVTDLLTRADQTRLRRCEGDGCGWFFLDLSRNHSRRWCDPADCGNRARVRAYTERQRRKIS